MTAEQKELFRVGILRVLDTNRTRFGLGLVAVGHLLPQYGFNAAQFGAPCAENFAGAIQEAVEYLAGKGLAEEAMKTISRENRCWKITAAGIAFLDERG